MRNFGTQADVLIADVTLEGRSMQYTQQRFDEVLGTLHQERQRVDKDLRRLAAVAAYLGAVLTKVSWYDCATKPRHGSRIKSCLRRTRRRRCSPRRL